jgi:formamidopyrimidine-DNA glycosylase
MPELPDLEMVTSVLREQILGKQVEKASINHPLVVRDPTGDLCDRLIGKTLEGVRRRGKFLIVELSDSSSLVFAPMLTGRFLLCAPDKKITRRTILWLRLTGDLDLRYRDPKLMGKVYLVEDNDFSQVPGFDTLGPEATDPELTLGIFENRLRRHRGMIKNVLTNQKFLAGIGNAYADEILFHAGILPFRKRSTLTPEEVERLYVMTRTVLNEATQILEDRAHGNIDVEIRDFLAVHGHGGESCPVCGGTISEVSPNRRVTNFCRRCQR